MDSFFQLPIMSTDDNPSMSADNPIIFTNNDSITLADHDPIPQQHCFLIIITSRPCDWDSVKVDSVYFSYNKTEIQLVKLMQAERENGKTEEAGWIYKTVYKTWDGVKFLDNWAQVHPDGKVFKKVRMLLVECGDFTFG